MQSHLDLTLHTHPQRTAWFRNLLHKMLGPSYVPNHSLRLFPFQHVILPRLLRSLHLYSGAILADDLGLGKTHTALALAHAFPNTILLAPSGLLPMWEQTRLKHAPNLAFESISHTRFARNPPSPPTRSNTLVLIDEAHAFSNPDTRSHSALRDFLRATKCPTLFLSATPVGLGTDRLIHLLSLFLPPWFETLVLRQPLTDFLKQTPSGQPSDVSPLLQTVLIRRTRSSIPPRACTPDLYFPRVVSLAIPHQPSPQEEALQRLIVEKTQALDPKLLDLPQHPLLFLLLDRLASSPYALLRTLTSLKAFLLRLQEAQRNGRSLTRTQWHALFQTSHAHSDTQLVFPFFFPSASNLEARDITPQLYLLNDLIDELKNHTYRSIEASKIDTLIDFASSHLSEGRSVLVFSQYADTTRALFDAFSAQNPSVRRALVTGKEALVTSDDHARAHTRRDLLKLLCSTHNEPTFMCATDVLSEGFNLQSFQVVISSDLPWNPRRLFQRFGRIDRPHTRPQTVYLGWIETHLSNDIARSERSHNPEQRRLRRSFQRAVKARDVVGSNHSLGMWMNGVNVSKPESVLGSAEDVLHTLSLLWSDASHIAAWVGGGRYTGTLGWESPATDIYPPGTLLVFSLGISHTLLHMCFVPLNGPAHDVPLHTAYQQLRSILRRPAQPCHSPPVRAFRLGLGHALRAQDQTRLAVFSPPAHHPSTSSALHEREAAYLSTTHYDPPPAQHDEDRRWSALRWDTSVRHCEAPPDIDPDSPLVLHAFVHFSAEKKKKDFSTSFE